MKLEKLGPGSILGHFQIVDTLGSGGMGIVFRAHDLRLERQVALKVLSPELFRDDAARARFIREAQLAASVTHPNVAVIHEVHVERETPFIAMELVPGRNVKDLLDGGPMAVLDVLSLGRQICGALDAAHRLGIVHRDIKSSNIVVTPEGQGKVLDFGLAKALWELAEAEREGGRTPPRPRDASPERRSPASSVGGPRTGTGKVVGTPSYMSPEQTTGGATDERSDIFSLGVVLYECLTGRLPFRGATEDEVLDAIRGEDPPPIDHSRHVVPRELRSAIERCLAKRPGDRYASARELGEELGRIERRISTRRSLAPRSLARRGVESWSRLGVFPRAALVLLALVLAISVVHSIRSTGAGLFPESGPAWMVLARFDNQTGDPDFEGTIEDVLAVELDRSPAFKLLGRERLATLLEGMGVDASTAHDVELVRQACLRGGIPVFITGYLTELGGSYVLTTRVWHARAEEEIAVLQTRSPSKAELLPRIEGLAAQIRTLAGGALPEAMPPGQPPELWTSLSWEALRHYSKAVEHHSQLDRVAAVSHLRRAIELDGGFAMAHGRLARIHATEGDYASAIDSFERALENVHRLTFKERGIIESEYAIATGNYAGALSELRYLALQYPLDPSIQESLSAVLWILGDHAAALEAIDQALALSPPSAGLLAEKANILLFSGDLDAARAVLSDYERVHPSSFGLDYVRGYLALVEEDPETARRHFESMLDAALSDPHNPRTGGFVHLAKTHALTGRYDEAWDVLDRMIQHSSSRDRLYAVSEAYLLQAVLSLEQSRPEQAAGLSRQALEASADLSLHTVAGRVLARSGRLDEAERVLESLRSQELERGPTFQRRVEELRGEIALARGDVDQAIDLFGRAMSRSSNPAWSEPLARSLYLRGDWRGAFREYERMLQNRAALFMFPIDLGGEPLGTLVYTDALLKLSEIAEIQGEPAKARAFHQRYRRIHPE